ncbi:Ig mu chain C region membrane-bound form [Anabarilius grahami]|uniref:Ig mu chain C region membrane-bound form n=1 Tax=Anabarilius grahami TaxID=495550 RepID=A0A3N0Z0Y2_ANAGA|nr:Ig mu chain C region membrane-bound form [Anabarilius grahami]
MLLTTGEKERWSLSRQCSSDSEFLTIGCVTRGFSPADSLTFTWKDPAMKELTDFVQYPAFGSDGDYTKISHLSVKKSDWNAQKSYTCEASSSVGGKATRALINKASTSKGQPKVPADEKKFNVTIYRPDIINKDSVSLVCEVTSPKPGDVSIMWKVGNEPYIEGRASASILREDSTSLFDVSVLCVPSRSCSAFQSRASCSSSSIVDSSIIITSTLHLTNAPCLHADRLSPCATRELDVQ